MAVADAESALFATIDGLVDDPALLPGARAVLLLSACQFAGTLFPAAANRYWRELHRMNAAKILKGDLAIAYWELAKEHEEEGDKSAKADKAHVGFIPGLLVRVEAAKARTASDRDRAAAELAATEVELTEHHMPFGKKRVFAALADAWIGIDRATAIRLAEHMSERARRDLVNRMNIQQPLTPDEWRLVATTTTPNAASRLAAYVLHAGGARVHLPAKLVDKTGENLLAGTSTPPGEVASLATTLAAHERLVASLAAEGRNDEAWSEVDRLWTFALRSPLAGPLASDHSWLSQFAVLERAIGEGLEYECLPEDRFAQRVAQTSPHLQAFARAAYRALVTRPGGIEEGYRVLERELSPSGAPQAGALGQPRSLQRLAKHTARLADGGHRAAALDYYLFRVATRGGLAQEALDATADLGDGSHNRSVVIRGLLEEPTEATLALMPPEQLPEGSVEHFLALGTAERRAQYLSKITGAGTRTIPGCVWRDWDAAQAMPKQHGFLGLGSDAPRPETVDEYCQHNPIYHRVDKVLDDDKRFPTYVDSLLNYEHRRIDDALLAALVRWSEMDWQPAREAMIAMWEAIKPIDPLLFDNVMRNAILERATSVLAADPEVLGTYVLPWLHDELVKKDRTWTVGNSQITLRLDDWQLALLSVKGAQTLAQIAPARRDRVVEIALGYAMSAPDIVKVLGHTFMQGRPATLVPAPPLISGRPELVLQWQQGEIAAIMEDIRRRFAADYASAFLTSATTHQDLRL